VVTHYVYTETNGIQELSSVIIYVRFQIMIALEIIKNLQSSTYYSIKAKIQQRFFSFIIRTFLSLLIPNFHIGLIWFVLCCIVLYCIVLHAQLNKYHVVYIINYLHKMITLGTLKRK
jgi:hypothetical protein